MKVGYSVEGSTDRAFLKGLKERWERWCPDMELLEGRFRGSTDLSLRREIDKICLELDVKNASLIIFLCDSNVNDWKDVLREFSGRCPPEFKHLTIFGVCDRNIECWICADVQWIANRTSRSASDFQLDDPKGVFENAMGITSIDRKEEEIATLIKDAPLSQWNKKNDSFKNFYEEILQYSLRNNCQIENIR